MLQLRAAPGRSRGALLFGTGHRWNITVVHPPPSDGSCCKTEPSTKPAWCAGLTPSVTSMYLLTRGPHNHKPHADPKVQMCRMQSVPPNSLGFGLPAPNGLVGISSADCRAFSAVECCSCWMRSLEHEGLSLAFRLSVRFSYCKYMSRADLFARFQIQHRPDRGNTRRTS